MKWVITLTITKLSIKLETNKNRNISNVFLGVRMETLVIDDILKNISRLNKNSYYLTEKGNQPLKNNDADAIKI